MPHPTCNFCQSREARFLLQGYGFDHPEERFDLYECRACGLVRLEPLPNPDQLAPYYGAEYYGSPEAKFTRIMEGLLRRAQARRARALSRRIAGTDSRRRRVLDVGCGRGLLLRAFRDLDFDAVGTELPGFAFPAAEPGLEFVHAPAEALPFPEGAFDLVSIWHVLEHTRDPATALREVSRVLRPGGVLVLAVPNFGSWQARHFGRHWFHLDLPRHLYHFRSPTLIAMLREQQIGVDEVRTKSLDQNLYGFVQSFLNLFYWRSAPNGLYHFLKKRQERAPLSLGRLAGYLLLTAIAFPLALMENLFSTWRRQGASLVLIGRKQRGHHPTLFSDSLHGPTHRFGMQNAAPASAFLKSSQTLARHGQLL
jgi:SAM-dependent methyltransferase